MPMLIERAVNGAYIVQFPLCTGDAVQRAGVTMPFGSEVASLLASSPAGSTETDTQISLDVSAETLRTGEVSTDLVVVELLPTGASHDPADAMTFFAYTTQNAVEVDVATLDTLGGEAWLARGVEGSKEFSVDRVTPTSASYEVANFCARAAGSD